MVDGQPVIVKNGMPGQRVRFMINKKKRRKGGSKALGSAGAVTA